LGPHLFRALGGRFLFRVRLKARLAYFAAVLAVGVACTTDAPNLGVLAGYGLSAATSALTLLSSDSTVEFIELTSAVPFTLAQLKEFTLARGFIPSLHGATTLPMPSHPSGGG
jgi:hypothetical protein